LNVFAMPGCVLAVFVSGDHGQLFQHSTNENYFYSTALAVIGSTMFSLPTPETRITLPPTPQSRPKLACFRIIPANPP
jgi:hypothetical protein